MAGKLVPADVRKQIAADKIPSVWLWAGPEDFLKEELLDELLAKVVDPSLTEFLVHRYRAGDDLDNALMVCRTLPMMGGRQVVEIRDVDRLRVKELEALAAYVGQASPETALVLTTDMGDRDETVRELAQRGAALAVFWPPYENQLATWVVERFQKHGKQCDAATAKALLETIRGGTDTPLALRDLSKEIEKVVARTGERAAVNLDDLGILARHSGEKLLFDVADRTLLRDNAGALRSLDSALRFKENNEVLAVALITRRILVAAATRQALDAGLSPDESLNESRVWERDRDLYKRAMRLWTEPQIRLALRALINADRLIKSTGSDPRIVLEGAIAMICRYEN